MRAAVWALCVAAAVLLAGCAGWNQPFDRAEWALLGASTVAQLADWQTTSQLGPTGNYESNPIMGRHPDQGAINDYFISSWLIKAAVAKALTHEYRKAWLGATTVVSAGLVFRNCQLDGVGFGRRR